MVKILPTFEGWTIDTKLKMLRKVSKDKKSIQFLYFDSELGDKILSMYIQTLNINNREDKQILDEIWS